MALKSQLTFKTDLDRIGSQQFDLIRGGEDYDIISLPLVPQSPGKTMEHLHHYSIQGRDALLTIWQANPRTLPHTPVPRMK